MLGIYIGHLFYHYPNLPEQMPIHFNPGGNPDSWARREAFLLLDSLVLFFILMTAYLPPILIAQTPSSRINLPNKEHWLAPEHREETYRTIGRYFEIFGAALFVLFTGVNELVFRASLRHEVLNTSAAWALILAFLIFTALWLTKLYRHFRITV